MSLKIFVPLNNTINNYGPSGGTTSGLPTYSNTGGRLGGGKYSFDSANISFSDTTNLSIINGCTVSVWIYPTAANGDIYSNISGGPVNFVFGISSLKPYVYHYNSGWLSTLSTTTVPLNTWTHITWVCKSNTVYFYINGELKGSGDCSVSSAYTGNIPMNVLGSRWGSGQKFQGALQDFRVYDDALSSNDIHWLGMKEVGHWTLDENSLSGPNLITSLISGRNCTVSGNNISVSGTNSDSYFWFNISEAMVENGLYKISCRGSGFPNGSYYNFPIAAQSNSGPGVLKIQNGYCLLIFVANNTIANAGTRILMDDNERVAGAGTISDIRLVKLNKSCDISGNHNDLTINGICSVSTGSKRYSKCINLPEATTLTCANPFVRQTTQLEWSISCWVKASALTDWLSKLNNFNVGNYLKTANNLSILYLNSGTNDYYSYAAGCPQLNTWTHVVFVFRNSDGLRQVWINGVLKASNGPNKTSTPLGMPATIEWFAAYGGDVSDLRLYATALSASDIQYLYSLGN